MNNHQLEARAAKAKVDSLNKHIEVLQEHIDNLQRTVRKANEIIDDYRQRVTKLEGFVSFAHQYYPGSVQQFNAIKALEGATT